jgi:ribosomal protein S1
MQNYAEGYLGQEQSVVGRRSAWNDVVNAYKGEAIIQVMVSSIEMAESDEGALMPNLVVWFKKIRGVVSFSESGLASFKDFNDVIGQVIALKIINIDDTKKIFVASRVQALEEMAIASWATIKMGQVRVAVARAVTKHRLTADIGGIAVSIPAREISYYWVDDVRDFFNVGDSFGVKVTSINHEERKIDVSVRLLHPDPWLADPGNIPRRRQRFLGVVAAIKEGSGMYINLEPGFVCFYGLRKNAPIMFVKGDRILVEIREVNPDNRRILVNILEHRNRNFANALTYAWQ